MIRRLLDPGNRWLWRFLVLTGHFFRRFFRNDLVDFEDHAKAAALALGAILTMFQGWVAIFLFARYAFMADTNLSWREKTIAIACQMTLTAILAVLQWEVIYPDRRDQLNLKPLPISLATLVLAKTGACLVLVFLFSTATSLMVSLAIPMYVLYYISNSSLFGLYYVAAYLVCVFLASLLIFFLLVALRTLLAAALPRFLAGPGLSLLRLLLLAGLFFFLFTLFIETWSIHNLLEALGEFREQGGWAAYFPPLWFSALFEVMIGNPDPFFLPLAGRALLAVGLALAGFVFGAALGYAREAGPAAVHASRRRGRRLLPPEWRAYLARLLLPAAEERAMFFFVNSCLRSSSWLRLRLLALLSLVIGTAAAMFISSQSDIGQITGDNPYLLSLPLFLSLALIAGFRYLVEVPVAFEANWLFRLSVTGRRHFYLSGAWKAVLVRWLLPLWAAVFLLHAPFSGAAWAAWHALFGLALSLLVYEVLFFRIGKIPFTCGYLPGRLRLEFFGGIYLAGFIVFLLIANYIERELLNVPNELLIFVAGMLLSAMVLRLLQKKRLARQPFIFEESPDPAMVSFPEDLRIIKKT